jgi:FAD/FMN-containing dehydrogenase
MNRRDFFVSSLAAAVAASLAGTRALAAATAPIASDVAAVTGSGAQITLGRAAVEELRASLRGALLLPDQPGYDEARRVLNASIDRHPALVVQPTGVADVRTAVSFARQNGLLLAVKCGGHSFGGKSTCDGGMQIDLSRHRGVRVDPVARVAYVAGGSLLGDLDHEAMSLGLVTTAGTVSHTGVGGLTLGGGFGRLARRFGLALDNVLGVDIVTADGKQVHASADEHPDLFWGIRGGGGNFGVVTTFEFRLHPMARTVVAGEVRYPLGRARELLEFFAEFAASAPDELYVDAGLMAPPGGGEGMSVLEVCYSGPPGEAERLLAPISKLGRPLSDTIGPKDYVAVQRSGDQRDARNIGTYLKSGFLDTFPPGLSAAIVEGFQPHPERFTALFFQQSGGAVGRVPADATAFPHRASKFNMLSISSWDVSRDGAPHLAYGRKYWATLEKYTNGYYTNEVANEPQRQIDENYQGNIGRRTQIKNKYDPTNLFRLNANVRPTA